MHGHELRNPLAPIVTATQSMALRGSGAMEKERKRVLDFVAAYPGERRQPASSSTDGDGDGELSA
jgi:hypothetical protein